MYLYQPLSLCHRSYAILLRIITLNLFKVSQQPQQCLSTERLFFAAREKKDEASNASEPKLETLRLQAYYRYERK